MIYGITTILLVLILVFDSYTPLGVADSILYIVPIMIASRTRNCRFCMAVTSTSMVLVLLGYYLSPQGNAPLWIAVANRLFAEIAIISTATVLYYQMRAEKALQESHALLEHRVAERTQEFQQANILLEGEVQERIHAEIELKASMERLSEAQAITHLGSWEQNLLTNELFWSDETFRVLGMDQRKPKPSFALFMERVHPDDRETLKKAVSDSTENKTPLYVEYRYTWEDGSVHIIETHGKIFFDNDGKPLRSVGTAMDITERRKAEETLRNLNSAIDQAAEVVIITDSEGTIEYANPAVGKATGYKREELIGKNPRIFKSGRYDEKFYKKMWGEIKGGRTWHGELVNRKKDGTLCDEEVTISPIFDASRRITHFVAIKRVITEEKLLRQQLLHSDKLSAIGTFISGVAHELNNPLTSIIGFSKMLINDGRVPKDVAEKLKIISEQADRTSAVVKSLLKFSKPSKPEKKAARLNDMVEEMVALNFHSLAYHKINIARSYAPDNPWVFVAADSVQQVFVNIIMNACSAMKEAPNPRTLTVRTKADGKSAFVEFENTGSAIPEHLASKIFDPFFTSKGVEGTGLGLYISFGIVQDNGGRIWAENLGAMGVRFTVSFPIFFCEPEEVAAPVDPAQMQLGGLRVLFADDEAPIRNWIGNLFFREGIFVQFAHNGLEAKNLLAESNYDVIVSNVNMPVMDGFQLGEWIIKEKPQLIGKLILATGAVDGKIDKFCAAHGCSHILKPYSKDEILETIATVADSNPASKLRT